ncbi:MAG: hypothetical protein LAT54_05960 [Cryomorphaceae bacterium]|nr:hypothetical protein [Cryomorphaceae bacterium]
MRYLTVLAFILAPVLFSQCINNEVTLLQLQRAVCSGLAEDFSFRDGTPSDPVVMSHENSVFEIAFITQAIAANITKTGSSLYALTNSRTVYGIDSVSAKSSVSIAPGIMPSDELIDDVITLVHYPNLQFRDFRRTLNQFNEKITQPRLSSKTHYLYFRLLDFTPGEPFDLSFNFYIDDGSELSCDCGWFVLN